MCLKLSVGIIIILNLPNENKTIDAMPIVRILITYSDVFLYINEILLMKSNCLMNEGDQKNRSKNNNLLAHAFLLTEWNVNNPSINMRLLIN